MKKYFSLFLLVLIGYIVFHFYQKQNDWSEINSLIYDTCVIDGQANKTCTVDFHKLNTVWDEIYFLGGGEQGYIDKIIGSNTIQADPYCEYLVLKEKNTFKKVYTQCFDSSFSHLKNIDDSVRLLIDLSKCDSPQLNKTFGEEMILQRYDNYYKDNQPVVYELGCEK
ncbi:MAG: hypothetical protein ABXS91_05155 [Sulfurimonas sp.]